MKIRIGGVPEHFNMPWHWANAIGLFKKEGIEVIWTDFSGGTGAMNKALRENELDMALLLTEGAVTDIIKVNPSKILSFYVDSPLVWGVHTSSNSTIEIDEGIFTKKFAISRLGSGSHLMAKVFAKQNKAYIKDENFVLVNNLEGAVQALSNGEADIFLWEKFTTKPLVDRHIFKRIGECPTPWACFVIVVRNDFYKSNSDKIKLLLQIIQNEASKFKNLPNSVQLISEKYGLKPEDVNDWMKTVSWSSNHKVDEKEIYNIVSILHETEILSKQEFDAFSLEQVLQKLDG
jgi:ABC-type nitrate/sulfonate/bicarbonate transport system substrate-binding protein